MKAEHRDIPGFPGYRVGDDGSVWSCWRAAGNGGPRMSPDAWRRLPGSPSKKFGRPTVGLSRGNKSYTRYVHRLVLEAFVGPRPKGMECRHKDGDRTNNRLDNLIWGTRKENEADKVLHGRSNRGERNGQAKLTSGQVREIRAALSVGGTTRAQLARQYGVSINSVCRIATGQQWGSV